jgi:methylmalonyl-CoA mutase
MKDLKELGAIEHQSSSSSWQTALKAELKLETVESKLNKYSTELGQFPILSLESKKSFALPSYTSWKKASQTYVKIKKDQIQKQLQDDFEGGVRVFFFYGPNLDQDIWNLIQKTFDSFNKDEEIEIFILDSKLNYSSSKLKVFDSQKFLMDSKVIQKGGHNIHELGVLLCKLIESESSIPDNIGVHVDSNFFRNIAKIRALRILVLKVLEEFKVSKDISIVALNSYSDWTLYERYSNILRNTMQVSSSLISGAEYVQSSGYQTVFYHDTLESGDEHDDNSYRIARNSAHVLALESMLGITEDASHGSFHLESLTQAYVEGAWNFMQKILPLSISEREELIFQELSQVQSERLNFIKKRKKVISGINDFPDAKERLNLNLKDGPWMRVPRIFEELRLKVESLSHLRAVKILVSGDHSALNARLSFIRNYFELLGLVVIETHDFKDFTPQDIIVLCAKDEDYLNLVQNINPSSAFKSYIAGKVDYPGFSALYSGQDVYEELDKLVQKLLESP